MIWKFTKAQAVHCWKPTYISKLQIISTLLAMSNLNSSGIAREKWEKNVSLSESCK